MLNLVLVVNNEGLVLLDDQQIGAIENNHVLLDITDENIENCEYSPEFVAYLKDNVDSIARNLKRRGYFVEVQVSEIVSFTY